MYLNYFPIIQQILSGLVVSGWLAWRTVYLGHGFEFSCLSKKKEAENSSTLCKNHKGRKGLPTDVIRRAPTVQKLFRSGNAKRWKLIINYTTIQRTFR